jgi:DNA repair protein RadD
MTPRPDQRAAVDAVLELIRAGHSPLLVSPTGSGKTFMGSLIVRETDLPTIWTAHRSELVDQAWDALRRVHVDAGVHMSGRPHYANRQVHVASVGTAAVRPLAHKRLIIADEAHHVAAGTHQRVRWHYPDAPMVGLTATPFRLDGKGLGDAGFTHLVIAAHADELAAAGHLVEPKVFAPPPVDMAGLKVGKRGDYNGDQMAQRFDRPQLVGDVVATWRAHADGYRTVGFACNLDHSKHMAEAFRAVGVAAEHVDGDTPAVERKAILDRFRAGATTMLWNKDLLGEGVDVPEVECVILDRATASLCFFLQAVGRAMRVHPGKRYPVLLDHAGNVLRHGRVTRRIEYSLTGRPRYAQGGGGASDLRNCPGCFRVFLAGRTACPECGLVFATLPKTSDLPEHIEGQLQIYTADQLDAATLPPEQVAAAEAEVKQKRNDAIWWRLTAIAKRQGFKPGWVSREYQRQTGEVRTVRDVQWDAPEVTAAEPDLFSSYPRLSA